MIANSKLVIQRSFFFLVALFSCMLTNAAEESNWSIENRLVPPPAAASDALRSSIAGTPQPNVENSSQYPQSNAAWLALIDSVSMQIPLELIEQTFALSIETDSIDDVTVYRVTPEEINPEHEDHIFLYVHGGAYVFNGGDASVSESALISATAGMRSIAVDYRMPPNDPFPAAVEDVVVVYEDLLEDYAPHQIAIGGTSAGAGLAMAVIHQLKSDGTALPGVLFAGTPWADLTKTSDSLFTNEGIDRILVTYEGYLKGAAELYAGEYPLTNPLLSPIYGDFENFPPTILVSGTRDLFLSDTVRVHRKLRAEGIVADLHVYEAMSHAEYGFLRQAPESQDFYQELSKFLNQHLR